MFCSLTVFQLGKKTVTATLQICRNYNERYHATVEPHEQQDGLRAHFVGFLCIGKIKGLRAEQILESGSKTMLLSAAGLPFTNCSLVLHHCPLGFGAKTTLVDRIWQKNDQTSKKTQTSKQNFLALFSQNNSGCVSSQSTSCLPALQCYDCFQSRWEGLWRSASVEDTFFGEEQRVLVAPKWP